MLGRCFACGLVLLLGNPASLFAAPSGLYSDWAVQVWGADRTNTPVASKTADPDGDEIPNFLEYALGLDPLRAEPTRFPGWVRESSNAVPDLLLRFASASSAREAQSGLLWARDLGGPWSAPDQSILRDNTNASTSAGEVFHEARLHTTAIESTLFARLTAAQVQASPRPQGSVWFEAEPPNGEASTNLSGGQMTWCGPGNYIQKSVVIPADGTYTLWVRKFWNPQTFRWRMATTEPWMTANNPPLQDLVVLSAGRQVGWMSVGSVALTAGTKTFRLEVTDSVNWTAYDCFVLTREPFTPRGKFKPGDSLPDDGSGFYGFLPENDPFDFSPIDLRWLNERQAGDGGFITVQGEGFIHANTGEPARFWAVNTSSDMSKRSEAEMDLFASTLAKKGVNLVRIHSPTYVASGANFGQNDTNQIYRTQHLVTALKRQGIYTLLSIYFPLWVNLNTVNTNFSGYTGGNPFALLYFNQQFQALHRTWWDALLGTTDPETGVALKDEPALAMVEIVNEDSLFFWTFNPDAGASGNIPDPQRAIIEKFFGDWLLAKYPGKALSEIRNTYWGGLASAQDDFANGRVAFRNLWSIANERTRRDCDTARFMTELQTGFYRQTCDYLKNTLKYRGLVYASNWQTADAKYLGPLDKWSCSFADFMDRHGYFGSYHSGDNSSWSIQSGQLYDDRAAVKFQKDQGAGEDFNLPIFDIIYNGKPSTITEINWTPPNRFRADFPVLASAYGCLQGSDGIFHFADGSPAWDGTVGKFSIATPADMGQFPATALIFRRGLLKTGPRVVNMQLLLSDLYNLRGTPIPAPVNFDQLRAPDIPPGTTLTNVSAVDSLAFTVGRVGMDFITNGTPQSQVLDLSIYVDRTNKVARSQTGELEWDWGQGLVQIKAPAAQGITGFLNTAGSVDLPDVTIQSTNEYGSILLVALDEQPLRSSSRILLQVMTEEKPYGWTTDLGTGQRTITSAGQPPVVVRNADGFVSLKRADASGLRVSGLDFNGYRDSAPIAHGSGIQLQPNRLYYLIEK